MKQREPDLRKLASRQRWLVLLTVVTIGLSFGLFFGGQVWPLMRQTMWLAQTVVHLSLLVALVSVLHAHRSHVLIIIACGVLALAPCFNLLLVSMVILSATRTLVRAGIPVGLMGAHHEDVERILNPALCTGCGYNLTGNVSGRCPECGRELDQELPIVPDLLV